MNQKEDSILKDATPCLISALFQILMQWETCFQRKEAFQRALELGIASLLCLGRKTIASMAIFLQRTETIPIAYYKFFSDRVWQPEDLFRPILAESLKHIADNYITVGVDDTRLKKTGKKIPSASWGRDPLSPPFQTNLIWGLRELHFSIILPLYGQPSQIVKDGEAKEEELDTNEKPTPARAIPIRWINAPSVKKPGKKASDQQLKEYKTQIKTNNLSTLTMKSIQALRNELDQLGQKHKILIITGDCSFCNRICFGTSVDRTIQVCRCKKNSKLCFKAAEGSRRFYDERTFTPEEVRKDESIPWQTGVFFFGGRWREMKFKEVKNVLWRNGAKRKLLRLLILAPTPYIKGGKRNYRDPAYLLATDNEAPATVLVQAYLDRWQMEYCHRDAKSIIGVGQAQVWNENSVERQPAFHVATYSTLILANIITYGDRPHSDFGKSPKWRKKPRRLTIRALVGKLRGDLIENPGSLEKYGISVESFGAALRQVV